MVSGLFIVWVLSLIFLKKDLGKAKNKPKFSQLFSKSSSINYLSAARFFLFGARDIWFVIALPVYMSTQLGWEHWSISTFIASWIIGYGIIQSISPVITGIKSGNIPNGRSLFGWAIILSIVPLVLAINLQSAISHEQVLLIGLLIFGFLFAINSAVHSYLVVSYSSEDSVSLDVGFYYMANSMGRLIGTVLSGWLYQDYGLSICLYVSTSFIFVAAIISLLLPKNHLQENHL